MDINGLNKYRFRDIYFEEDMFMRKYIIERDIIEGDEINKLDISLCYFKKTTMNYVVFDKMEVIDSVFENCDLSNSRFQFSSNVRVTFKNCKMLGCDFSDSYFSECIFENCDLSYANFSMSHFKGSTFRNCRFIEADLIECKLLKTKFESSELIRVNFNSTKLNKIDFSSNIIVGLGANPEDIYGCKMSSAHVEVLAGMLGVEIVG
ncbi:hypothetical protein CBF31_08630 [Vagococcus fessus]|uniref:Quinolone resistance protein n=2 Tax=Vagococcus fessus TaxID=120370 RepID=A0A430A698_9ENTE|nr:hypothetical protein CBF31_08630 [Vagococcus fessus]